MLDAALAKAPADLAVLDRGLPGEDGLAPARDDIDDRSIDSRVSRLRAKLAALGIGDPIRTLRSFGYVCHIRG